MVSPGRRLIVRPAMSMLMIRSLSIHARIRPSVTCSRMEYQRPPEPAQTRANRYLRRAAQLREMARVVADKSAKEALTKTADEYAALAHAVRLYRKHERLTH